MRSSLILCVSSVATPNGRRRWRRGSAQSQATNLNTSSEVLDWLQRVHVGNPDMRRDDRRAEAHDRYYLLAQLMIPRACECARWISHLLPFQLLYSLMPAFAPENWPLLLVLIVKENASLLVAPIAISICLRPRKIHTVGLNCAH